MNKDEVLNRLNFIKDKYEQRYSLQITFMFNQGYDGEPPEINMYVRTGGVGAFADIKLEARSFSQQTGEPVFDTADVDNVVAQMSGQHLWNQIVTDVEKEKRKLLEMQKGYIHGPAKRLQLDNYVPLPHASESFSLKITYSSVTLSGPFGGISQEAIGYAVSMLLPMLAREWDEIKQYSDGLTEEQIGLYLMEQIFARIEVAGQQQGAFNEKNRDQMRKSRM